MKAKDRRRRKDEFRLERVVRDLIVAPAVDRFHVRRPHRDRCEMRLDVSLGETAVGQQYPPPLSIGQSLKIREPHEMDLVRHSLSPPLRAAVCSA